MADAVEKGTAPESVIPIVGRRGAAYRGRFILAYLLVFGVFIGVVALFAVLVSRSDSSAHWSAYKPKGGDVFDKAQHVADYVAPRYIDQGSPVAVVEAQPLIVQNTVVDGIAFSRQASSPGSVGGGFKQFEPSGSTIMYVFCGPADKCSLPPTATAGTDTLLRRESLELALYTFKYSHDVNSIVALLPPFNGTKPAIFLKRKAFEDVLSKPLDKTLPARRLITPESMSDAEVVTIERLTANSLYASAFQELPNGRSLLVLASGNQ